MGRMTPRERILAAFAHRQPDRVPFSWGFGPTAEMSKVLESYLAGQGIDWGKLRRATDDKMGCGAAWNGPLPPNGNTYSGIFGINMKKQSYGNGSYDEFTDYPLAGAADLAAINRFPWPDAKHYDYASVRENILKANPDRFRAVSLGGGNPFEIYCWMTGLEESLCNLILEPDMVRLALKYITDFFAERMRRTLEVAGDLVDMVFLADDLGGQNGLLLSRETYCAVIQPYHKQLVDTVRQQAPHAKVFFHSDGAVFDILPDLLDAGIDMLEAVQTDCAGMDPERLKATYGKRLGFHGAISVQQLLPHTDAANVTRECKRLVQVLGKDGGYIAAPAHAIQVGTPPENVMAMLKAVLGDEDFAAACKVAALK